MTATQATIRTDSRLALKAAWTAERDRAPAAPHQRRHEGRVAAPPPGRALPPRSEVPCPMWRRTP